MIGDILRYVLAMAVTGLMMLDMWTTMVALEWFDSFYEANPIMRKIYEKTSPNVFIAIKVGVSLFTGIVVFWVSWGWILGLFLLSIYFYIVEKNSQLIRSLLK